MFNPKSCLQLVLKHSQSRKHVRKFGVSQCYISWNAFIFPLSYTNLTGALVLLKYLFSHCFISVCSCCSHSMQYPLSALWLNFTLVLQDIFPIHPHLSVGWDALLSSLCKWIIHTEIMFLNASYWNCVFKYPYTSALAQCLARNNHQ